MPEEETFEEMIVAMLKQGRFNECVKACRYEFDSDNILRNHNWVVDVANKHGIDLNAKEKEQN